MYILYFPDLVCLFKNMITFANHYEICSGLQIQTSNVGKGETDKLGQLFLKSAIKRGSPAKPCVWPYA